MAKETKLSERWKKNIIALSITVGLNCVLCIFADSLGIDIYFLGLVFCPIFGGVFRSLVAYRRDVWWIIFAMAFLDIVMFVPLVTMLDGIAYLYSEGAGFGVLAAVVMGITGSIVLGLRAIVYYANKKSSGQ